MSDDQRLTQRPGRRRHPRPDAGRQSPGPVCLAPFVLLASLLARAVASTPRKRRPFDHSGAFGVDLVVRFITLPARRVGRKGYREKGTGHLERGNWLISLEMVFKSSEFRGHHNVCGSLRGGGVRRCENSGQGADGRDNG